MSNTGNALNEWGGNIKDAFWDNQIDAIKDTVQNVTTQAGDMAGVVAGPAQVAVGAGQDVAGAAVAGAQWAAGKVNEGVQYAQNVKAGADALAGIGASGGVGGTGNIKIDSAKAAQSAQELRSTSKNMVAIAEQFEGIISRLLASGLRSDANSAKIKSYATQIKTKSADKATKLNRFAQAIDEEVATVNRTENTVGSFDATVNIQ